MRRLALVTLAVVLLAACSSGGPDAGAKGGASDRGAPVHLAVLGDQRAFGEPVRDTIHHGWSQVLFTTSLPSRTVYVDLAIDHATVAEVRSGQVPQLAALQPTLIVVWIGLGDEERDTPDDAFGTDLAGLVTELRATKAEVVLVASGRYATTIEQVGRDAGVEVADVSGIDVDGGTEASQQQVAAAVAKAVGPLS